MKEDRVIIRGLGNVGRIVVRLGLQEEIPELVYVIVPDGMEDVLPGPGSLWHGKTTSVFPPVKSW